MKRFVALYFLVIPCIFFLLPACGDDDGTTPQDKPPYVELEQLTFTGGTSPTVSPDGKRFAYSLIGGGLVVQTLADGAKDTLLDFGLHPCWNKTLDLIVVESNGLCVLDPASGDTSWVAHGSNLEIPVLDLARADRLPSACVLLFVGT